MWGNGARLRPPLAPERIPPRRPRPLDMSPTRRDTPASMDSVAGKVAVVTGGASGIGRALCVALGRAGARVVAADVDEAGLDGTVGAVAGAGSEAIAARTDVSQRDQVIAL